MKQCKGYVGVSCVDGSCPIANFNYYMDEGFPDIAENFSEVKTCSGCYKYHGCEDCALFGTEYCQNDKREEKKNGILL